MHEFLPQAVPDRYPQTWRRTMLFLVAATFLLLFGMNDALAHAIAEGDKGYIQEISGVHLISFMYLGAKHMAT